MNYKRILGTQEQQERLRNEREYENAVKTREYETKISLIDAYRRREITLDINEKKYIPTEYIISIKCSQGCFVFYNLRDFQEFEIFDFILLNPHYALLRVKKTEDEDVNYYSTGNKFSKLSLFSLRILFEDDESYMLSLIRAMEKYNEIFISLNICEAIDSRNPVSRIAQIITDGIRVEEKEG